VTGKHLKNKNLKSDLNICLNGHKDELVTVVRQQATEDQLIATAYMRPGTIAGSITPRQLITLFCRESAQDRTIQGFNW
jgi:nitrate reductase cytochrome c-type subunit